MRGFRVDFPPVVRTITLMFLAHCTDVHLNFSSATALVKPLLASGADRVVITGDIAESESFDEYLLRVASLSGLPIYFVLGNHDFYGGSMDATLRAALRVHGTVVDGGGSVTWLRVAPVVDLGEGIALIGIDGLYDARWGTPESGMYLNDFKAIEDLKGLHRRRVIEIVQQWGQETAARGRELLRAAVATHRRVFFCTHVPPFPESVRDKEGKRASPEALPWYSSRSMGEMLRAEAKAHPDVEIVVLAGHTHYATDMQIAPNLRALVGGAAYFSPNIARTFTVWPGMQSPPPPFDPSKGVPL